MPETAQSSSGGGLWARTVRTVAAAKWGSAGLYQAEARLDPAIRNAMAQFGKFSGRP